jgi:hypothetical protein
MATTAEHSLRYRSRQCDDDIVRDRHAYDTAPFLAQACPMSFEGQKQTSAPQKVMSALPPIATLIAPSESPVDNPCSRRSFRIFDFEPGFRRAVQVGAVKGVLENQKSESTAATRAIDGMV